MRKMITSIGIITLILSSAASCDSTKKTTQEKENTTMQNVDKTPKGNASNTADMIEGTIVHSNKEGDCEYTIEINGGTFFDPINLKDEFKIDGEKILFTFSGLRMPNRCIRANPIQIDKIQKQ